MKSDGTYNYVVNCIRNGGCDANGHGEISMRCPGCGADDHFSVNYKNGLYNCFKCSVSGSLASQIGKQFSSWKKLVRVMSNQSSGYITRPRGVCSLDGNTIYGVMRGEVSEVGHSLQMAQALRAMKYCIGRGMTKKQVDDYKVTIKPLDSRVYFPYWDEDGEVIFTMGRTMSDTIEPKTLESGDTNKPLFGRHLRILHNNVVLVEGVFDHFVTPASYALMGSAVVNQQIAQLTSDGVKRVFLLLDPEARMETRNAAVKLARHHFDVYPLLLDGWSKDDPAKLGRQTMTTLVNSVMFNCPRRPQSIVIKP